MEVAKVNPSQEQEEEPRALWEEHLLLTLHHGTPWAWQMAGGEHELPHPPDHWPDFLEEDNPPPLAEWD